jgi:outer membrane protein
MRHTIEGLAARRRWSCTVLALVLLAAGAAQAKKLTLEQLLDMARQASPGMQAAAAATSAMEAQVSEARRNWLPTGDLLSILAPSPNMKCLPSTAECIQTQNNEVRLTNVSWNRVFTRTELRLIQPLWDFGKISAGTDAAKEGVAVAQQRESATRADVEQNVRKAYWGMKLARDVLDMLDTGSGYVDDGQKKLEKDLEQGTGNVSVTDKLRIRTVRAEVDARILEAKRGQGFARDGLRALLGPLAPSDIDVDDAAFEPLEIKERPVTYYEDLARYSRPEAKLLDHAVKAKNALADLERLKAYPDIVLVFTGAFARAQDVDDPKNAYLNHYFNSTSAGLAAALRMPLDLGPKLARATRSGAEAAEIGYRRSEALTGITFEVRKAYGEMSEAAERIKAVQKGERAAKSWISAVAQNFAVGLAEARDLTDALVAFFNMRYRYLQAVFDYNVAVAALTRATGASDL